MTDQYHDWRRAVETKSPVPFVKGSPCEGFYRVRARDNDRSIRWDAVAIWRDANGLQCYRSEPGFTPTDPDQIEELYASCNSTPVSYEDFLAFREHGRWPDEIEPVAAPAADLPPHEAIDAELTALRKQAEDWFASIKTVSTKEQADKAGNYADAFARIESSAESKRKTEKAPFIDGGKAVDATWNPIVDRAAASKTWAKKATEPYLLAEKKRLADEEKKRRDEHAKALADAAKKATEAEAQGVPSPVLDAPLPLPAPAKAKAGTTGRGVHLRSRTVHKITDLRALLTYFADMNETPADLMATLQILVNRMRAAGVTVPGVETETVEGVA